MLVFLLLLGTVSAQNWTFTAQWQFAQSIESVSVLPSIHCPDLALSVIHPNQVSITATPIPRREFPCQLDPNSTHCLVNVKWHIECVRSCEVYCPTPNANWTCLSYPGIPHIRYCQPTLPGFSHLQFGILYWTMALFLFVAYWCPWQNCRHTHYQPTLKKPKLLA